MNLRTLSSSVSSAIFNNEEQVIVDGRSFPVQYTGHQQLRFVDIPTKSHGTLRFIEQNPAKSSFYAEMARCGEQIVWIVRMPEFEYTGHGVIGGQFIEHMGTTRVG